MTTMFEIDKAAQEYAKAHEALAEEIAAVEDAIAEIKRAHHKTLRKLIESTASRKSILHALIDANRGLFDRPKTRLLHGVKIGLQKGKGRLVIEDDDTTVRLIRKHFPDQTEILIRCVLKPNKDALNGLDVRDLKKIGVTAEDSGEQIVIKPADGEIDKLVDALLAEEGPEAA